MSRVLPGIGVCQEVGLRDGRRIGIVTRRNGQRELVLYDEEGDGAVDTIAMSDDEANAVAEILGAPQLTVRLAMLQRQADELIVEQLPIPPDSPFGDRPLGDTQARVPAPAPRSSRFCATAPPCRPPRRTSCCTPATWS